MSGKYKLVPRVGYLAKHMEGYGKVSGGCGSKKAFRDL
jgi:hypothetical protein